MSSSFKVRLEELEQARANLANLLTDVFEETTSPANATRLRSRTASCDRQADLAGYNRLAAANPEVSGDSTFGPVNHGITEVSALNTAHGQAQETLLALVGQLNGQIASLHERVDKTHRAYASTEADLHLSIRQQGVDT